MLNFNKIYFYLSVCIFSRRWFRHQPTWFGRLRFRYWIRWFGHELAHEYRTAFIFPDAGLCPQYFHNFPKISQQACHAWGRKALSRSTFRKLAILTSILLNSEHDNFKINFSYFFFSFWWCHHKQGDLDRQRLLGNRQRSGVYESVVDDGVEGIEHQER